jgi:hypothetical protein
VGLASFAFGEAKSRLGAECLTQTPRHEASLSHFNIKGEGNP